jgi:hypothetical protein
MMRLGGPELKLPELGGLKDRLSGLRRGRSSGEKTSKLTGVKAPDFLVDLYWDLRDRHLLPLVALAVVACVAAPFLLGGGSESESPVPTPPSASSPGEAVAEGQTLAVARSEPGLREPSKRLRGRPAHDPFKPQPTAQHHEGGAAASGGGGSATATVASGGGGATTTTTTTSRPPIGESPGGGGGSVPSTPAGGPETGSPGHSPVGNPAPPHEPPSSEGGHGGGRGHAPGGQGGAGPSGSGHIQLFTFAIDVKITKVTTKANGAKSKPETVEKDRVIPPAALPGKKSQVVTYMGISPTTHQPLFLVSEAVTSVFGETKCVAGEGRCQLLELEKGFPVTFVYGENNVRYKIAVLEVKPVSAGHS